MINNGMFRLCEVSKTVMNSNNKIKFKIKVTGQIWL